MKVTCSQRFMRWMFDVQGSIFPPNVCSIQKTNLTPDCFCSWVEVVLKGLALWERDTHRQTMFSVIAALKPLVLELDSVSQRDFSSQSYMTVKVDWWQRRRAFLMSLFLKEVRENSNIEQNDRTEQHGNTNTLQTYIYSPSYLLYVVLIFSSFHFQ